MVVLTGYRGLGDPHTLDWVTYIWVHIKAGERRGEHGEICYFFM